jgi:hypothetical protein
MSDWVERARRRLGLEETVPDHLAPFGEDEAKKNIHTRTPSAKLTKPRTPLIDLS